MVKATSVATALVGLAALGFVVAVLVPRAIQEARPPPPAPSASLVKTEPLPACPAVPLCPACPAPCPEIKVAQVSPPPMVGELFFANASARLTARAESRLQELAVWLQREEGKIRVEGHTDPRGSNEENRRLADLRARSVASYLQRKGVDATRIDIAPGVVETPGDANTEASWAVHRRVQLTWKP